MSAAASTSEESKRQLYTCLELEYFDRRRDKGLICCRCCCCRRRCCCCCCCCRLCFFYWCCKTSRLRAGQYLLQCNETKADTQASSNSWIPILATQVIVPPESSARGKEWRLVVETCQMVAADGGKSSGEREVLEGCLLYTSDAADE